MSNRTAKVDGDGILATFVAQPVTATYQNSGDQYVEKWKGPYSEMRSVSNGYKVFGVTFSVGKQRPNLTGSQWQSSYNAPEIPNGYSWIVQKITAEQSGPGDHGILTVEYAPMKYSSEIRNFRSKQESWNINWQSQSVNVLSYCSNDTKDADNKAISQNIIACAKGQRPDPGDVEEEEYPYSWVDQATGETMTLNKMERAIFRKYINDKNPIFHYPVITHTQVIHCEKGYSLNPKIADDLDEVKSSPDENKGTKCPFDLEDYEWLRAGSNITCTINGDETQDFTIVDTWWGAKKDKDSGKGWDGNFYKNGTITDEENSDHWKLGKQ